jgi:spermidine synthase
MPTELMSEVETIAAPVESRPRRQFAFTLLLLISGFCGISYEVLYGRILSNFIGDQFAISASILLTFMFGLGVGSLYAHRLWRWLWAIEGGIGLYAAAMAVGAGTMETWFYSSRFLSQGLGGAMIVCFLLLIVPAFMVGCSLPLFAGYLGKLSSGGQIFARAYMVYNFGAALTVLVIEFVLLRALGIRSTVLIMAGLNVVAALLLFFRFRQLSQTPPARQEPLSLPGNYVLALALASIGSAVFQLLMVKTAECFLGPFRQTFALVLSVVLGGLAIGSALARKWTLSFTAVLVAALAGLVWMLVGFELVMALYAAIYSTAVTTAWTTVLHKVAILFLLMGVPAVAFGALIPALLSDLGNVARDSGKLLCVSSLANAAGFLLMAFVLHRYLDYGVVVLVVGALLVSSIVACVGFRARLAQVATVLLVLLAGIYQFKWDENLLYIGYDRFQSRNDMAGARAYLRFPNRFKGFQDVFSLNEVGNDVHFFINGYISIALNSPAEKIVGAFPSLFVPRSDQALVLGVGSGATCGTVATLFDRVDAVEINPVVLQNLFRTADHNFDLASKRHVNFVLDDGVHFTKLSRKQYTLIINTVTAPIYFSSSKLYTVDFLRVARRSMTPDGIYVTWVDARVGDRGLDIIFKTIREAGFKECALAGIRSGYFILLCSDQPIKLRHPELVSTHPELANYFKKEGVFPEWIPYGLLTTRALELIINTNVPVNTLDYPALEFQMTRMDDQYTGKWATNLREKMSLGDVTNALIPAMTVNLVDLALYTERLYNESSLTRRRLGLIEEEMEDFYDRFQPAKLAFYRTIADLAGTASARHDYAWQLMKQRKYVDAIAEEQRVLAIDGQFNNAYYTMAACQEELGQFDAALISYKRELEVDPYDSRIAHALGRVHYKRKDYAQAITHLERAIAHRDHFENHIYLSLTLEALGRKIEADDHFQHALKFGMKGSDAPDVDRAGAAPR